MIDIRSLMQTRYTCRSSTSVPDHILNMNRDVRDRVFYSGLITNHLLLEDEIPFY